MKKTGSTGNMYTLFIDTSSADSTVFELRLPSCTDRRVFPMRKRTSGKIIAALESFLREKSLMPEDIASVEVPTGPGSFIGLRIGAAIALAAVLCACAGSARRRRDRRRG